MYKKQLLRVSPESVGFDSKSLKEMLQRLETCGTEMHGFMLARHGKVVSECWWSPYHKDLVHICHSFGKSYVAAAVGLACTEGLLSVDDKMTDLFRDEIIEYGIPMSENLKKLTVEHVLTMSNGMSVESENDADLVRNYLSCAVEKEPGSEFKYNTSGSCMLGAIVQKVTGKTVLEYLTPRIFEKIGLETDKLGWIRFKNGIHAAPGVSASTENNLRLGMLYLNGGNWEGEQLIDREWMSRATSKRIDNDSGSGHIDGRSGYGYQLWMCREPGVYRFDGGHGQFSVMSTRENIVIAIHQSASMPGDTGAVMDILHEYILSRNLPDTLPDDAASLADLRHFEASRSLPLPEKSPVPDDYNDWNGIYRITEGSFHIHPELRPGGAANVYVPFYKNDDFWAKTISVYFRTPESCELVIDGVYTLDVRMDGTIFPVYTGSAIPEYYLTYSSGYFEQDGTLVIDTRYFQTCFKTRLVLKKERGGLRIEVRKETLHDNNPYYYYNAFADRIV